MPLIFSCYIPLATTCSTVLNKSEENKYTCLVTDLRGKGFKPEKNVSCRTSVDAFYQTDEVPSFLFF